MAAAQGGDRRALDQLLRRHHDRLYAVCRRLTGNDADGADALQDALISLVRGLDRFDGRSRFATWAYRVTVNACLDEMRRRRRRPEPRLPDDVTVGHGRDQYVAVDVRIDVDAALATLPADYRVAVVLRDLVGLSYEEIAEVVGVPVGTVRSRIARGRAGLVRQLSPAGNPPPEGERPTNRP